VGATPACVSFSLVCNACATAFWWASSCSTAPPAFCASLYTSHYSQPHMSTTLSVRIDVDTKKRLEALAKRARRSKSFLAAEAIAAFVDAESWQLDEIQIGLKELDEGRGVPHKDVANWLRSWGRKRERKAPRA
jgi:predicted transcriptional regulator